MATLTQVRFDDRVLHRSLQSFDLNSNDGPSTSGQNDGAGHVTQRSGWRLPSKFKLIQKKRTDPKTLANADRTVHRLHCKAWYLARGKVPPAAPMHPAVKSLIEEWFDAVDDDGSRTLEYEELMVALKAANIPAREDTIKEMVRLMDFNQDGVIGWDEFNSFMADEFNNGKNLLTGEYMLPSGATLNFGAMISKLKRNKLMREVLEGNRERDKWVEVAADPGKLQEEVALINKAAKIASSINELHEREASAAEQGDRLPTSPRSAAASHVLATISSEARATRNLARAMSRMNTGVSAAASASAASAVLGLRSLSRPSTVRNRGLGVLLGTVPSRGTSMNGGLSASPSAYFGASLEQGGPEPAGSSRSASRTGFRSTTMRSPHQSMSGGTWLPELGAERSVSFSGAPPAQQLRRSMTTSNSGTSGRAAAATPPPVPFPIDPETLPSTEAYRRMRETLRVNSAVRRERESSTSGAGVLRASSPDSPPPRPSLNGSAAAAFQGFRQGLVSGTVGGGSGQAPGPAAAAPHTTNERRVRLPPTPPDQVSAS